MSPALVIGLAVNYHEFTYERFLASLRNSGSSADVLLFVGEKDHTDPLRFIAENHRCEIQTFNNPPIHILSYRFQLFEKLLRERESSFKDHFILITDVRDVIFQRDPFSFPFSKEHDLFVFEEGRNIGECEANSSWIRDCFGEEQLDKLKNLPILCAGTTFGRYDAILTYLKTLNQLCGTMEHKGLLQRFGIDQAIHNYIVYNNLLGDLPILRMSNANGPVNTLHYSDKLINAEGRVTNLAGEVSYLAHQVDRMDRETLEQIGIKQDLPVFDLLLQSDFLHQKI